MAIVVQKYGGSSVADVDKLGRVADKVVAARHAGDDVVVVISAMGKTTDQLLALAKQVDENPPRRELDMLLSTGERVSMSLLSMAIQKRGTPAISFTGSQSGIITNDRHFDARILEVRPHRIEDELARGRVVIVAGYQGMSYRREITTLGRGGSDTTAIALAAALGAERAEIYSDVDGVYTADPRVVPDAKHLARLSYDEMQEMAEAGAKVLNATAVEFAKNAKITIHARSTFDGQRESVIAAAPSSSRTVTGQKGVARVHVAGGSETLRRALAACEEASTDPREVEAAGESASFLVHLGVTPDWAAARRAIEQACAGSARIEDGLAMVSVVGDGLGRDPGALGRALAALADAHLAPLRTVTTPMRLAFLLAEAAADDAVRALHAALSASPIGSE
jgi:aspartate kinase